ncbi:MAG: plasmid pRiA4b ORF-3 family protein [Acidobacteriia bacterium]|nr:plasmid pRiA4b ORF-3 family protein [Terriglobia bacterium]
MRQPETSVEVYAIKVTLLGTSPPVWRRILVPREITLRNLHRTLQTVMGWSNSHLHQFLCVAGKRCCPPEDCGGPEGFAELLKALQDANHPNHDETCEWLGDFFPESFSADEVNRRLCRRKH